MTEERERERESERERERESDCVVSMRVRDEFKSERIGKGTLYRVQVCVQVCSGTKFLQLMQMRPLCRRWLLEIVHIADYNRWPTPAAPNRGRQSPKAPTSTILFFFLYEPRCCQRHACVCIGNTPGGEPEK